MRHISFFVELVLEDLLSRAGEDSRTERSGKGLKFKPGENLLKCFSCGEAFDPLLDLYFKHKQFNSRGVKMAKTKKVDITSLVEIPETLKKGIIKELDRRIRFFEKEIESLKAEKKNIETMTAEGAKVLKEFLKRHSLEAK